MNETIEYINLLNRVTKAVSVLPRRAAALAVNFSKQRFRDQSWVDNTTEPWKKRRPGWKTESRKRQGLAVLIDSGRLRRSIRTIYVDDSMAIIGTDVPYARAHNNGFRGRVKQQVRTHMRHAKGGGKRGRDEKGRYLKATPRTAGTIRVRAHSRTLRMNLPRRRFIGASAILDKQVERMMTAEIIKAIKG